MKTPNTTPSTSNSRKSVFDNLRLDRSWDFPAGTRIQMYHDLDASPVNAVEVATLIVSICNASGSQAAQKDSEQLFALLGERFWGDHEHRLVLKHCELTSAQRQSFREILLEAMCTTQQFCVVYNCLEQFRVFDFDLPTDALWVLSCHKRLVYPCFDIMVRQQSITREVNAELLASMMLRLGGHRKLAALRMLGPSVSPDLSRHVLATRISSVGSGFGYTLEDHIDSYLEFLSYGKLLETLRVGHPGEEIMSNLTNTYAEISELLFEDYLDHTDEPIKAFPHFVKHLENTPLGFDDLINLNRVHDNLNQVAEDNPPENQTEFWRAAKKLSLLFQKDENRLRVLDALKDLETPEFADLIEPAVEHYGENRFDQFFKYAQHSPLSGYSMSYWLYDMTDQQRHDLIEWVRSQLPAHVIGRPLQRDQDYSKVQTQLLSETISKAEHTLVDAKDRGDFIRWGMSSTNDVLASNAAWLLEDITPNNWPTGVHNILCELADATASTTTSWKTKEHHYVKAKDRLTELVRIAGRAL